MDAKEIAEEALRLAKGAMPEPGIHVCEQAHKVVQRVPTLARAYLALLPPAGAWSHDEGDVVLTHPDGSTERFYAGERAPFIVAACSRYEALVSDLPVVIEAAERDAQLAEDEAFYERDEPGGDEKEAALLSERAKEVRAACGRLRALGGGT